MAKDIYDKLLSIGDIFKKFWLLGVMIAGASLTGNVIQATQEKPVKEVKQEKSCDCMAQIKRHEREYHQ